MSKGKLLLIRLRAEIEAELESLTRLQDDLDACVEMGNSNVTLRAKASIFHDLYTGIERIFAKIAAELNGGIPNTPQWHADLLQDMSLNLEDVRPHVITGKLRDSLLPFLRFRHLFRNLYGFNLDPPRMAELNEAFSTVLDTFNSEMHGFINWLRDMSKMPRD